MTVNLQLKHLNIMNNILHGFGRVMFFTAYASFAVFNLLLFGLVVIFAINFSAQDWPWNPTQNIAAIVTLAMSSILLVRAMFSNNNIDSSWVSAIRYMVAVAFLVPLFWVDRYTLRSTAGDMDQDAIFFADMIGTAALLFGASYFRKFRHPMRDRRVEYPSFYRAI